MGSRILLASVGVLLATSVAAPAPAEPFLLGVDVSHWQGEIDWGGVATDPQRVSFAVLKASAGRTNVDARYQENRTGALTHGILIAAYHFAYPDQDPGDALAEADHFVNTAALAADRVIPALDLENASLAYWPNITAAQLLSWATTWLERVRARTGIRAMVYTNPSFWSTRAANSDALARAGYPLWIAHWGAVTPAVPAGNWAGNGWRCWQYSSTGRVAGVPVAVDMDRMDVASFRTVTSHGGV